MQDQETINKLKLDFVEHLQTPECCGILYLAAKKIDRTYKTVWLWMEEDQDFKDKVLLAQTIGDEIANDVTEASMMKRIQKGSDRLIQFRLLNRKKDKYGKSGHETTNNINNIVKDEKTVSGLSKAVSKFMNRYAKRTNSSDTGASQGEANT